MWSGVAGILDRHGGLRVVVTEPWRMQFHVNAGERLFVLPDWKVREPIEYHLIPQTLRAVELYVEWWITSRNDPGDLKERCVRKYLANPNAYHNRDPSGYHYLPVKGRKVAG